MRTNFSLMQHHNYSLAEIENMIPWEREAYLTLLTNFAKEESERTKQVQQQDG